MGNPNTTDWYEANQRYMTALLNLIQADLENHAFTLQGKSYNVSCKNNLKKELQAAKYAMPAPSAAELVSRTFGLSPFEQGILLLSAGIELNSKFAACCSGLHEKLRFKNPTFGLAMAALPGAHWSAFSPTSPLRYWHLIEIGGGETLISSPLRIDERILNYLVGVDHMDERLGGLVREIHQIEELVPSHQALAEKIVQVWFQTEQAKPLPVIVLSGTDAIEKQAILVQTSNLAGLTLHLMSGYVLPPNPAELDVFARLWDREAALSNRALLLDCDDLDTIDPAREDTVARFIDSVKGPLVVTCRQQRRFGRQLQIAFDVCKPNADEQLFIWQKELDQFLPPLDGHLDSIVAQFNLTTSTIRSICSEIKTHETQGIQNPNGKNDSVIGDGQSNTDEQVNKSYRDIGALIWSTCRNHTRPKLGNLAQSIEPLAVWNDLVLPGGQKQILQEIMLHVRHRLKVYKTWGFAAKSTRGLGISALFTGPSGTGKTLAVEILANKLRLDLLRIDLSQIVDKYIGETEKHLARVFDEAETGGAVLFFDEADALFGKRSEVKDSHDRYANIEISYLLQRMEAYKGLAIMATNMKNSMDSAFLRRIRFIVQFPFPDNTQRAEIWRRIFPEDTPTEKLNINKLSRLNISGGTIRNIAMNAAFRAADTNQPVKMTHILSATKGEYAKMEKPLSGSEVKDWG
jgi:SpoVK/Ycf46/Vps4 family AAA+-type ATPase